MKYQFCIRFDTIDANSAASKAVMDCNTIFKEKGYLDYTFTVRNNKAKLPYYFFLFRQLIRFFFSLKRNSIVGIQYPLLSINSVFKYFIRVAKFKNVKFFCVVHDLEALRTGGKDKQKIAEEVSNINYYDAIIVHNSSMLDWLTAQGVKVKMIPLELFDYLADDFPSTNDGEEIDAIVYAGNLNKSKFIHHLKDLGNTSFNLYGPYTGKQTLNTASVKWFGEASPDNVPKIIKGRFGLIWDGEDIDKCDDVLGNYLRFNNPHKCSLYFAAGIPVIAPADSAIGKFIEENNVGFLIHSLKDIDERFVDRSSYEIMKQKTTEIRKNIITGHYLKKAVDTVEKLW